MAAYLGRRIIGLVGTLLLISIAVFAFLNVIPGDPAQIVLGIDADPAVYEATRLRLGLDRPAVLRYVDWLVHALRGDLGTSLHHELPISALIGSRLALTLPLTGMAMVLAVVLAIPLGVFTATRHNRVGDYAGRFLMQIGMIFPEFWIGILLILLFSVQLHWTPAGGFPGWGVARVAIVALLLPAVALAMPRVAVLGRLARASFLEVLNERYISAARAKGLAEWCVLYKHAMKNTLIALATLAGLLVAQLIAGSIIIENVFYLPGVGRLVFQAISSRDLPLVQGITVVIAFLIAAVNFSVDVIYGLLDPRIRYR